MKSEIHNVTGFENRFSFNASAQSLNAFPDTERDAGVLVYLFRHGNRMRGQKPKAMVGTVKESHNPTNFSAFTISNIPAIAPMFRKMLEYRSVRVFVAWGSMITR